MAKESAEAGKSVEVNVEKLKALQATLDKIEKDFGKGTIMKLGDQPNWEVSTIPSGSIALDHALGIGGYPRGRVIEIYAVSLKNNPLGFEQTSLNSCTAECKSRCDLALTVYHSVARNG